MLAMIVSGTATKPMVHGSTPNIGSAMEPDSGAPKRRALMKDSTSAWPKTYTSVLPGVNWRSTWKSPMNTGICTSIGRQPPSGLTPCSDWIFCISIASFWRSLPYFSRNFCICGANSCILRIDRTELMAGFSRMIRRVKTRNTTESAHAIPLSGLMMNPKTLCQNHMMADTG